MMDTFDFLIIGAGSAGCVLANRLSTDQQHSVCLLEAGPEDKSPLIRIPAGVATLIQWAKYNWKFDSAPEPSLNDRNVYCPRGKTLGGSSAINAMVYIRGQRKDYQRWESEGAEGWGYDDLLPHFKSTMQQINSPDIFDIEYHGFEGELKVSHLNHIQTISNDFVKAAQQTGIPYNPDFNGAIQEGIGLYQTTTFNGERCSTADAFLKPIIERPNLTIKTTTQVAKIIFETSNNSLVAKGIELVDGQKLYANKEVILSAGAFQSPQLLMLSGIGEQQHLQQHGITCLKDLPEVGQNLQEHVDVVVVNRAKNKKIKSASLSFSPLMLPRIIKEAWRYFSFDRNTKQRKHQGLFSSSLIEAGGFIKSDESIATPDLQLMCTPGLFNDHGRDLLFMMGWGFSIHVTNLRPFSRGQIRLRDANPKSAPDIQLNILSDDRDFEPLIRGIHKAREIFDQPILQSYQPEEIFPGKDKQSEEELKEFIRDKANHVYHPVSSCRMGKDSQSVVDLDLLVRGTDNLRVIDASVFPSQISGNTNATVIAIADKAAQLILKKYAQ